MSLLIQFGLGSGTVTTDLLVALTLFCQASSFPKMRFFRTVSHVKICSLLPRSTFGIQVCFMTIILTGWACSLIARGAGGVDRCRFGVRSSQSIYGTSSLASSYKERTYSYFVRQRLRRLTFSIKYLSPVFRSPSTKHQQTRTQSPTIIHHVQSYPLRTRYIRKARFRTTGSEQRASRPLQWPC